MALRLCAQPAHRSPVWNALSDSPASCGPGLARDSLGRTRTTRPSATPYLSPNGSRREDGANEARRGGTCENDSSPRRCAREPVVQMPGFLGRLADVLARHLLSWLHRRVEPGSREWLDALTAESECAEDGWQRLRWALGGVPLVWTINQRRQRNEPARGIMRARIVLGVANIVAIAGWYAVIIPATYGATHFLRCHLSFGNQPGGCQEHPFVFASIAIGGAGLGMIIALALRARFAAYWWAVFSAFNTVGSVWYLRSGIVDLPRYGATQSAMLMAATFGVVLAAIMRDTPGTETDSAGALIAGTISFAMVDALIRMRDRLLVADNVNHYAVLGSAMFAAMLAGLIGRHERTPVERPL